MNTTCLECAAPRSLCQNCDNPRCNSFVCASHLHKWDKMYLCFNCYFSKFAQQQARFVSVQQLVVIQPLVRFVSN